MRRSKPTAAGAVSAVLLAALVGCGSEDTGAGGGGSLSVDRLVTLAEEVGKDGSETCPLPYDAGKATEAAKVEEAVEPGAAGAEAGEPVATAEGGRTTDPGSPWSGKPGALVTCSYHVGGDDLEVHTAGTEAGKSVFVLAPVMQQAGGMSIDELKPYTEKAAKAKPGQPVQSEGGTVVTVPLDPGGTGDVTLVLTVGDSGKSSLKPEQVLELARTFAAQAK
ncbi:hypothetical protein [Streptomyces sp. NPDC053755]|uniref:hypothetical protein n=1 Tax=Streptomyces sp. NPDC053755 TaxID=3155815 RepID=UPI00343DF9C9